MGGGVSTGSMYGFTTGDSGSGELAGELAGEVMGDTERLTASATASGAGGVTSQGPSKPRSLSEIFQHMSNTHNCVSAQMASKSLKPASPRPMSDKQLSQMN